MRKIRKINDMLEIPKEVYSNEPKMIITGFSEIIIENYKGILEYEDYFVKISTYIGSININGMNLDLEKLNGDNIKIKGKIESFDMERTVD